MQEQVQPDSSNLVDRAVIERIGYARMWMQAKLMELSGDQEVWSGTYRKPFRTLFLPYIDQDTGEVGDLDKAMKVVHLYDRLEAMSEVERRAALGAIQVQLDEILSVHPYLSDDPYPVIHH
ncbi:hypothetical protein KBD61_04100 [Patescibacteria group bacterium]|nr:hypothetical protein [Patescibacteria group bacterium]MBP9710179.1 hypothetical protein [Patescibacteria group bacterium]